MQKNTNPFPFPPCFERYIPSMAAHQSSCLSLPPLPTFPPLMSNRARKRVFALLRAADGSAFQKWSSCQSHLISPYQLSLLLFFILFIFSAWLCCSDDCGLSVAAALLDMHEGECKGRAKRIRGVWDCDRVGEKLGDSVQPRSPFQFFMYSSSRNCLKVFHLFIEGFDVGICVECCTTWEACV